MSALTDIWATLPEGTTLSKLNTLNAMMVPSPTQVDVSIHEVADYLAGVNKMQGLSDYIASPPPDAIPQAVVGANYLLVILSGTDGPIITTSRADTFQMVQDFLAALMADPRTGITQDDVDVLLAKITPPVPWWHANGYPAPIGIMDLIAAGNLF